MSGINSITQRSTFIFPSIPRRYGDASITTARNFQPWVTHLLQTVQTYINDSLRCGPCWIYAICGPRREAGRPKPYAVGRNGVGRLLWRYHLTIPCSSCSFYLHDHVREKCQLLVSFPLARLKRDVRLSIPFCVSTWNKFLETRFPKYFPLIDIYIAPFVMEFHSIFCE